MSDPLFHVAIMLGQLAVGLAAFTMVYTITGQPVPALVSALVLMVATTAYWVWEVTRD